MSALATDRVANFSKASLPTCLRKLPTPLQKQSAKSSEQSSSPSLDIVSGRDDAGRYSQGIHPSAEVAAREPTISVAEY